MCCCISTQSPSQKAFFVRHYFLRKPPLSRGEGVTQNPTSPYNECVQKILLRNMCTITKENQIYNVAK